MSYRQNGNITDGYKGKRIVSILLLSALSVTLSAVSLFGQLQPIPQDTGVTGFGLALRKLPKVGSVLYITAHPDDENNALLVRLSRGEGYRTALMCLTRGDGGQNEIGSELFEALGLLRTGELMAIHRYDGAEQYFSRAFEFGYSFSVEETFQKWGHGEILKDIVRVIREFRPYIIVTLNPSGTGGGQHHQASAVLAAEAFRLAGDPSQFPEQIAEGLLPWRPLRLFQSMGIGMSSGGSGGDVQVELGAYDPLLGATYAEVGALARGHHRSQGMNVLPRPDPYSANFFLANSTVESSALEGSFFDQIDDSLQSLLRLDASLESSVILLDGYINWAQEAYSRSDYISSVKAVMTGLDFVRRMQDGTRDPDALFLLKEKEKDFLNAAEKAHFISAEAFLLSRGNGTVVPGEEIAITASLNNRSSAEIELESIELSLPEGWEELSREDRGNETLFRVKVGSDAPYSAPYWSREAAGPDRFVVQEGFDGTEVFVPPPATVRFTYRSSGIVASVDRSVQYRWFDAGDGMEKRMALMVVPALSLSVEPAFSLVRLGAARSEEFKVRVTNYSPGEIVSSVALKLPQGWTARPASVRLNFSHENETRIARFRVTSSARLKEGIYRIGAEALVGDKTYNTGFKEIAYSHVETRLFFQPAESNVTAVSIALPPNLKVGYVMGVGDEVGQATERIGASVTYLTEDDLASGDLNRFDVIVTGVRAYLNREDLISNNHRLLEYVKAGGHLVVQYNKYEFLRSQFAPYPLRISRPHDRVTVEESPVSILEPRHLLFRQPNQIREQDWENWVQERGLYFLGEWDPRYKPLLELQDPWAYNNAPKKGSLVITDYGKGSYIYTGLAFFRQLPAGVPGAYRIWANLISYAKLKRAGN
ncbi:MAG: PIG-L family deacetylase [Acidobacteriota bacterium]|nr:MAG: PIG-L family deacetylase [Acidobacteriota bacterium]